MCLEIFAVLFLHVRNIKGSARNLGVEISVDYSVLTVRMKLQVLCLTILNCTTDLVAWLQEQLSGLRAKPLDCGSVDEWEDQLTRKRRQIKKKKEQLRRIQDDGNIDVKISLAEMEYSLEKDQIDMMNLSQNIQSARMENVKMTALKEISKQENLFRNVENSKTSLLYGHQLDKQHLENICVRYEGFGLEIREDSQDDKMQAGDRVIEVNGEDVLRILPGAWQTLMENINPPA